MINSRSEGRYRFADFTLDRRSGQLRRNAHEIDLRPKAYELLVLLLEGRGRLFSKDELLDTLWPDTIASEDSLTQLVHSLRAALGDAGPHAVVNVPRRGYRFALPVERPAPGPRPAPPPVQYATSGDAQIAYQVIGDGPFDLVYIPGWVSHLDYGWESPVVAEFLSSLAEFSRLILFDKRGTGLSDRGFGMPTIGQRMEDLQAVLEAAGSTRTALLGMSEGGGLAMAFAARFPARVSALVLFGAFARRARSPDYPWAPTAEERQVFYDEIERHWGGPIAIDEIAPSLARDPAFREWWSLYQRRSASPADAMALARMNTAVDVIDLLPGIHSPTLVLHRADETHVAPEEARFLADRIPGATLELQPGEDHLIYAGDQSAVVESARHFLQAHAPAVT